MGWAHNPVWTHTKQASEEQKEISKKLLTNPRIHDIITTKTGEGKPHKPERVTTMTKNTMNTILSLIATIDTPEANEVRETLTAELNKGAERKAQTAELYETVKPIVFGALSETPATIAEIFNEIESELPEGFTKSKLQYAITRLWKDEVTKVEGKVNSYALKA